MILDVDDIQKALVESGADPSKSPADQIRHLHAQNVTLQRALDNIPLQCLECNGAKLEEKLVSRETAVFASQPFSYETLATVCLDCGFGFLDYRAEMAEMKAREKWLVDRLVAAEIAACVHHPVGGNDLIWCSKCGTDIAKV